MANIEKGIEYCLSRWHVPKYVMGGGRVRNSDGSINMYTSSDDCSSFSYKYLIAAGFLKNNTMPTSTEGLFAMGRKGTVLKQIYRSECKRGDIFVAGVEGQSLGAYGHTGVFLNNKKIIHCTAGDWRTVVTHDESEGVEWYLSKNRYPVKYFRPVVDGKEVTEKKAVVEKKAILNNVIDISEWQDPAKINYDKLVKNIDGAIIRCGYTYSKDKSLRTDKHFETHYRELSKRNVPLGTYYYSMAINTEEAIKEANKTIELIKGKKFALPVYLDVEDHNYQAKSSKEAISNVADVYCKTLESKGYYVGIYSYPWFTKTFLSKDVLKKYTFWIADYVSKNQTSYSDTNYDIWQFTSKGKIAGYDGDIDINKVYKDLVSLIPKMGLNGFSKETKVEVPNVEKEIEVKDYIVTDEDIIEFFAKKNNVSIEDVKKNGIKLKF